MASVTIRRQDMPPQGGYKPIPYKRVPARRLFNPWALYGGYLALTAGSSYLYYLGKRQLFMEEIEERSANMALFPLLLAERDRAYLKQLRRNRESEAELMKDVKGWKVGTWYGEPIYHHKGPHDLFQPIYDEYFVHASRKDYNKRATLTLWS